jgi:hypothetical protein
LIGTDAWKYALVQPVGLSASITTKALTITAQNKAKATTALFSPMGIIRLSMMDL